MIMRMNDEHPWIRQFAW